MTTAAPQRGSQNGEPFNPRRISPSRVNALVSCGVAFRMKYLEGLPEESSGSAALFGSVVHLALERWAPNSVDADGVIVPGRSLDLLALMRQAWLDYCDAEAPELGRFIREYAAYSTRAIRLEHDIRSRRPDIKAPRMTKDWKQSDFARDLNAFLGRWIDTLNDCSRFQFSEYDPLPSLYDESLVLAKRYEAKWKHLPPSLHSELGFEEQWNGFVLHGYIDTVERLVDRETGEEFIGILDYKTYRNEPAEHKDWRQVVIYDVAVRSLMERGVLPPLPDGIRLLIGIDYVRLQERKFWEVGPEDYERLLRELESYSDTVERGNFLPAEKGRKVDFCPYPSSCCLRSTLAAGGSANPVEVNL